MFGFILVTLCFYNGRCSLPKSWKSSLDHCCSVVVVLGWHTRPPDGQGSKRSLLWPEIPAVQGGCVVFFVWSTSTAEGCCLATGGDLLVVCSQCMLYLNCSITELVMSSHQVFVSRINMSQHNTAPSMKVC